MIKKAIEKFRENERKYFELCEKQIIETNMKVQKNMSIALVGIYIFMMLMAKVLLPQFRIHPLYYFLFIVIVAFFLCNQFLATKRISLRTCRTESLLFYGLLYLSLILIDIVPYKTEMAGLFPYFLIVFSVIYIDKLSVYIGFELSLCAFFCLFDIIWKERTFYSHDIFQLLSCVFIAGISTRILLDLRIREALNKARLEEMHSKAAEAEANAIAANSAKSQFLSQMSHEIRTPINGILGMNELIMREYDDEQLMKYAHGIKSAGNTLLSLINDVLDFSKIEAGKMELYNVEYDLTDLISELVNMVDERAKNKGLELVVSVNKLMPHKLYGDNVRLKQVILNILTNAVKYTEHGSIHFDVDYMSSGHLDVNGKISLKVSISDTGIGIREEDMQKLFAPFERLEESRNRNVEGSGLGMSIVQKFLGLMNSELHVRSEYGKGSTFSFTVEQETRSWEPIGDFEVAYEKLVKDESTYTELFTAPEASILVVDDNDINLVVTRNLLKDTQIKIETASSGKDGLILADKKRYDLILIDHRMPEMDGMEMLWRLRSNDNNMNINTPCIALTANAFPGAREVYKNSGFEDYLSKPIIGDALEKMLLQYLPKEKINIASEGIKRKTVPKHASKSSDNLENTKSNIRDIREDYSDDKELYAAIGLLMKRANI